MTKFVSMSAYFNNRNGKKNPASNNNTITYTIRSKRKYENIYISIGQNVMKEAGLSFRDRVDVLLATDGSTIIITPDVNGRYLVNGKIRGSITVTYNKDLPWPKERVFDVEHRIDRKTGDIELYFNGGK